MGKGEPLLLWSSPIRVSSYPPRLWMAHSACECKGSHCEHDDGACGRPKKPRYDRCRTCCRTPKTGSREEPAEKKWCPGHTAGAACEDGAAREWRSSDGGRFMAHCIALTIVYSATESA